MYLEKDVTGNHKNINGVREFKQTDEIFIVASCILILSNFFLFSPTDAPYTFA
jgi:hypothetical protein